MRRPTSPDPRAGSQRRARRGLGALAAGALAALVPVLVPVLVLAGPAAAAAPGTQGVRTGAVGGDFLASTGIVNSNDETPVPAVGAASWLVADATTGTVLAAKDAHGRFLPASTLKTLTALTLLPRLDKTQVYVGRAQDIQVEGTKVGIVAGLPYTVDQLFYGLFLASGNDAASALANAAGGWAPTVQGMNQVAVELQADDTHAVNPSGLDAKGQVTSAYDLALFARAGLMRPDFRTYTSTHTYQFPGKASTSNPAVRSTYQIQNQNRLLMHGYAGMVGVKTGYTTLAGRTYVGAAERGGHLLVVTLMKVAGPTEIAAHKLLDWGFANVGKRGVGELVPPLSLVSPSPTPSATTSTRPVAAGLAAGSSGGGSALRFPLWLVTGVAGALAVGIAMVTLRSRRENRRVAVRLAAAARRSTRL
jgi:serine-type D-Ala-D-Ala carboxypeptidase (penicillin-binding protein 5/6)